METKELATLSTQRGLIGCLALAALTLVGCQHPLPHAETIENFRLLDSEGRSHELYRLADRRGIVFVAHGSRCSESQDAIKQLELLKDKWHQQRFEFFVINAEPGETRQQLNVPILKDEAQIIMPSLGLLNAGEALVVTPPDWSVSYRGPVNLIDSALSALIEKKNLPSPVASSQTCSLIKTPEPVALRDIAPIIEQKCLICHFPGGTRPQNLSSANDLRSWAPMIREVLRKRLMPPWLPDTHVGRFQGDYSLTHEETQKIISWLERGAPVQKGLDPESLSLSKSKKPFFPIRPPDEVFAAKSQFLLPSSRPTQYQTFSLGQVKKDSYIMHISANDGSDKNIAHHYALLTSKKPLEKTDLEAMNVPDGTAQIFLLPRQFSSAPTGTYYFFPKGTHLYLRAHYEPTGKTESLQPEIKIWHQLYPADQLRQMKPIEAEHIYLDKLNIPARSMHKVSTSYRLKKTIWLFAISVHMHYRGHAIRLVARLPDGTVTPLISIPAFSLNRQNHFQLAEPLEFPPGTEFLAEGEFDNTPSNPVNPNPDVDVHFGPSLKDEMFAVTIHYYFNPELAAFN